MAQTATNDPTCQLLGGIFSVLLQLLLGFAALSTLVYKRMLEVPKRPVLVWLFDTSKQAFGSLLIHLWNMALSIWIAKLRHDEGDGDSDECAMYFLNFSLDIFLGTALIWALVWAQKTLARKLGISSLRHTGLYGDPPSFRVYLVQLLAFIFILVLVKTALAFLVLALNQPIENMAKALFKPLRHHPELELTIVMIVCPFLLNSFQYWLLDTVVMHKTDSTSYKRIDDNNHLAHTLL